MGGKQTEACGRCSTTTVLDATAATEDEGADDAGTHNPFDGDRIELSERELTSVVRHEVAVRRLKDRLDAVATRLTFGG